MEPCQNCKHDKRAHMHKGCACGCAAFQPANAPIVLNSIIAGEDISQQIERLRRIRAAADKLDT
jgi:hypothetical protein